MKAKKLVAGLLAAVMLFGLTGNFALAAGTSDAQTGGTGGYHYDQLDELGKVIYDGIRQMKLTTGTDEYDLVGRGLGGSALPGSAALNAAMNAARYAYYADHPEVFYVDFPKLTLRITQDQYGGKHVTVGSGRNASYLNSAFAGETAVDAAVNEFNARVDKIVAGAKAVTPPKGESLQAAQIEYVHNEIVKHTSYRLEDTAATGNAPLLGTPYGVLVKKQGVCEGYARAFKTVMDQLGINCILVQGVHQYDGEAAVNHMWNYVEITDGAARAAGKWYAVDATLDDPEVPVADTATEYSKYHSGFAAYGKDGFEQQKYLLCGQLTMNEKHFEAEEVAAAGDYSFKYPTLEDYDFTVTEVNNDLDGFKVITQDVTDSNDNTVTAYQFSYLGMTVSEAREKGIYLVWRYYAVDDKSGAIVPIHNQYGSWFYLDPDSYSLNEENGYTTIQEGNTPYVEIAATTVPPTTDSNAPIGSNLVYQGNDSGLIARTGNIYNKNQNNYVARPYVLRQTPTQTSTINLSGDSSPTYHITAVFDEDLALAKDVTADKIGTRIECWDRYGAGVTGDTHSEIKNFKWDSNKANTVEFDMTFSLMYADSNVIYNIYLEGLVGETSLKTPNPISYTTRQKGPCPCVMERDGNWDVFGKPTLLEGEDLSLTGWETANGQPVDQLLSHRLALVTTSTTERQNEQIAEQVEANMKENIVASETYNVGLSLCKSMVIKTGSKLKVRLGFPEDCGPDSEGVTFKAYHFKQDSQGNITGVEEIECIVTQYGLILLCDAFSPFMIAAVKEDGTAAADRTVVVTAGDGGTVSGPDASGLVKLKEGQSQTVTFTAKSGYQIESVTACGKEIAVKDSEKQTKTVTVSYDDVQGSNNIVNANFVADEVVAHDESKGQTPVSTAPEAAEITDMPASLSLTEGDTLTLEPTVAEQAGGVQTFQWCRNGVKLEGRTGKKLTIENVAVSDAGAYTLKVTTTVDSLSTEIESSVCAVTVAAVPGGDTPDTGDSSGSYVPIGPVVDPEPDTKPETKPETVTKTVTNPDGSRTTTVTNKTAGTVTETTRYKDGSTLVVETQKDGTKITTSTAADGVEVKTVDAPNEAVTASVTIPEGVGTTVVTIPAAAGPGMVAVDAATGEVVKLSVAAEDGMLVRLDASAQLILEDRATEFTDSAGHWAEDAIDFATAHNLFAGTGENKFTPDAAMTRAMVMTVLARFDGEEVTGGSTWYEKGVAWAVANDVSDGSAPGADITREELADAMWRYAGRPAVTDTLERFPDADSVSGSASDAMRWAVSAGIIVGTGDGRLAPQDSSTRAQVATILMRYVASLTKGSV